MCVCIRMFTGPNSPFLIANSVSYEVGCKWYFPISQLDGLRRASTSSSAAPHHRSLESSTRRSLAVADCSVDDHRGRLARIPYGSWNCSASNCTSSIHSRCTDQGGDCRHSLDGSTSSLQSVAAVYIVAEPLQINRITGLTTSSYISTCRTN